MICVALRKLRILFDKSCCAVWHRNWWNYSPNYFFGCAATQSLLLLLVFSLHHQVLTCPLYWTGWDSCQSTTYERKVIKKLYFQLQKLAINTSFIYIEMKLHWVSWRERKCLRQVNPNEASKPKFNFLSVHVFVTCSRVDLIFHWEL